MKSIICLLAFTLIIYYCECCLNLKHQVNGGTEVRNYVRQVDKKSMCNSEIVYKMVDNSFYIYKLRNGYWCEKYIPNELVNFCLSKCDETRFNMTLVRLFGSTIPESYDAQYKLWRTNSNNFISCADNQNNALNQQTKSNFPSGVPSNRINRVGNNQLSDKTVSNSNVFKPKKALFLNPQNRYQLSYSVPGSYYGFNKYDNRANNYQYYPHQQPKPFLQKGVPKEDPTLIVSGISQNEFLNAGSNILPNGPPKTTSTRLNQIQQGSVNQLVQDTNQFLNVSGIDKTDPEHSIQLKDSPTALDTSDRLISKSQNNPIQSEAKNVLKPLNNRQLSSKIITSKLSRYWKSCPVVEFKITDNQITKFKTQLYIQNDMNCNGFPIFKSIEGHYIYRNIFGDWCQDVFLETFQANFYCFKQCSKIRILPSGIIFPSESTKVESVDSISRKRITLSNYQYSCLHKINCLYSSCLNNGTCIITSKNNDEVDYSCNCKPNYKDSFCQTVINKCESVICLNNGVCQVNANDDPECACLPGFTGKSCETIIDNCTPNPCANGTCTNEINSYKCVCNPSYTGVNCDTLIDMCDILAPCKVENTVACVSLENDYKCDCKAGFTGINCTDQVDICNTKPCLHGTCKMTQYPEYECTCNNGYTGQNCETKISPCIKNNIKCNNGECVDLNEIDWYCNCTGGFTGEFCSDIVFSCSEPGHFADSTSCEKYIECKKRPDGNYLVEHLKCPIENEIQLLFNETSRKCVTPDNHPKPSCYSNNKQDK